MSFANDIAKWARKAGLATEKVPAVVCLKMTELVVEKSPVDTGRFKGNWQPTIGTPASGSLDTTDKSGANVLVKSAAVSQSAAGNVFYLVNNLPYARRLEYGYSSQAPAGMVRVSVQEFQQAVAEAAREVSK